MIQEEILPIASAFLTFCGNKKRDLRTERFLVLEILDRTDVETTRLCPDNIRRFKSVH